MTTNQQIAAKLSLAFLWIFTGLSSLFFAPEVGYQILETAGITDELAGLCLIGGALTDIGIGIWIISGKLKRLCCYTQILVIFIFSVLLTFIAPSFWIHPFGPVSKNIPIIILIWATYSKDL